MRKEFFPLWVNLGFIVLFVMLDGAASSFGLLVVLGLAIGASSQIIFPFLKLILAYLEKHVVGAPPPKKEENEQAASHDGGQRPSLDS